MKCATCRTSADILVDPEGALEKRNHWEKTSHALLVGAILHVLYAGEDKTLRGVANFLSDPACPFELTLHRMMTTKHLGDAPHPVVASAAREVLNKSDNERSGVLSTAMSFLGLYRDPTVAEVTSRCDWRIADLIAAEHPVSLYLVVPPSDISRTNALRRLGSGWALFIEAERRPAADYPHSDFPEPLSWLVDEERRAAFEESGNHYESSYHLTLAYLPPEESRARAAKLLYEHAPGDGVDWRGRLDAFVAETDRVFDLLDGVMPEIAWLDDAQTLTYLHATVSTRRYRLAVPEAPFHLDALLADSALVGGLAPTLGDQHLRVVSVRGFPTSTWPGLLDDLNRLGFGYRWSTRFLCLDKAEAEKELGRLRRQWFAKRKNVIALLRETIFQQESPLVDTDASNKAADADAALQELGSDQVAFGYLTATVTVLDADPTVADEKLRMVERVIQGRGFVTIPETLNAVDAWLSSIPGNAYANVRQPIVSTLNLAHMMPVSAVWAGPERNKHLDGPPLIVTRTDGATPFRLVTHIGDVGHTMIVGPTGMGKSVLVAMMAMQFRRYRGSRVFVFDVGRSIRAATLGLGGEHYDLSADGEIAFQPLARIDREGYRTWAAEWIEGRLLHEGVTVGPDEKAAIWSALGSLAGAPVEQRTLTGLSVLLQSNVLRQALAPYVLGGAHGKLLDADHDRLGSADVQCFEMEELMHSKAAVLAVLNYLFARLEERFDGSPTMLFLGEAWVFLDDPIFAARLRQWLKTLRKKQVSVVFDTQSLADVKESSIAPAVIESCASRIFLPNPQATEPQIRTIYEGFGLNSRQIEIVATAQPKRDYYYQSRLGNRLFDLDLGPVALAFAGASTPQDPRDIERVLTQAGAPGFAGAWLRHRGLDWAADLLAGHSLLGGRLMILDIFDHQSVRMPKSHFGAHRRGLDRLQLFGALGEQHLPLRGQRLNLDRQARGLERGAGLGRAGDDQHRELRGGHGGQFQALLGIAETQTVAAVEQRAVEGAGDFKHVGVDEDAQIGVQDHRDASGNMIGKRRWPIVVLTAAPILAMPGSAVAITVFDPSNFVQNTLTAIRTLEQINNQIHQLQNEARMLMNQARNLAKLDFDIVDRLRSTLATTERLIAEAQGLAYDVTNMDREFARLYPEQHAATVSSDRMARDARER